MGETLDLIESLSEAFPIYSCFTKMTQHPVYAFYRSVCIIHKFISLLSLLYALVEYGIQGYLETRQYIKNRFSYSLERTSICHSLQRHLPFIISSHAASISVFLSIPANRICPACDGLQFKLSYLSELSVYIDK